MSAGNRLHIESIRVKDLYAFACDFIDSAVGQEISPITKQRALSQSKNPYADENDVALLVAFIGGKCVGYQGLLPVRFMTPMGPTKAFWCTAMYVHPEYRNRSVATYLVKQILSLRLDCLISDYADAAGRLCAAVGFRKLPSCTYLDVCFDRLDWVSLPFRAVRRFGQQYRFCRKIGDLGLKISDTLWLRSLKWWIYGRLRRGGRQTLEGFTRKEVARVRPPERGRSRRGVRFVRDVDAVNWTLEYPWIKEGGEATRPPYYFADVYPLFRNHAVEVYRREGEYQGFVMLTILKPNGRTLLKVRDFDLGEHGYEELLFQILIEYAAHYRVDQLELPVLLESWVQKKVPFASLVVQRKERPYQSHPMSNDSPLAQAGNDIGLDLSDGDTAFF